MTRLKEPENSSLYSKMRVYNGESLKDTDPNAKSIRSTATRRASTRA
jgi:serine protein kinase